jgi:NADH dehydrogenase FAD-containing subunit
MVKKLNKIAKDKPYPAPFSFHNRGSLAYIGNWSAILSSQLSISLLEQYALFRKAIYDRTPGEAESFMSKETGRVAWLLWRSAYFTMTLSVRNKYVLSTKSIVPLF